MVNFLKRVCCVAAHHHAAAQIAFQISTRPPFTAAINLAAAVPRRRRRPTNWEKYVAGGSGCQRQLAAIKFMSVAGILPLHLSSKYARCP